MHETVSDWLSAATEVGGRKAWRRAGRGETAGEEQSAGAGRAGLAIDVAVVACVALAVAGPMLFTNSGFAIDFTNHLWLTWEAGKALAASGHPSYFLNAEGIGVFYPWFAFYGGTLYAFTGGLAEALGGKPVLAYEAVTIAAIAGAYGGTLWLARQVGVRGWGAHAPALCVVTSAYFITNLYGRGAWTELVAVAAIPPLLASATSLVRSPRWRPLPILVFVVSVVFITGSHNITVVWGAAFVIVVSAAIWLSQGMPRELPLRRLATVGLLALTGVAINAWYLIPDIVYAHNVAAHAQTTAKGAGDVGFDTPGILFYPFRRIPQESTTPALYVQIPELFLVWGLVVGAASLWGRRSDGQLRRLWVSLVLVVAVFLALVIVTPVWRVMPYPLNVIQFPYRLGSYIFYGIAGLVLVGVVAMQRLSRVNGPSRRLLALRAGLAFVCAASVGLCVWQEWAPNTLFPGWSYPSRGEALASAGAVPRTWYDPGNYSDRGAPVVGVPKGRTLTIHPEDIHGDRFAGMVDPPPGLQPTLTDINGGPYLVHVSGLTVLGRNKEGYMVVRRRGGGSGAVYVVVETAHSSTLVAGWVISGLGLVGLLVALGWARWRMPRRGTARVI
jgi:hypothetical protein